MTGTNSKNSVLFVCMGNICRSPAGEGVMRSRLAERGLENEIHVDSAGTIPYHAGDPPDPRMVDAAARRGYSFAGRARMINPSDAKHFDLIVAMDRTNRADILERFGSRPADVRLLSDFLDRDSLDGEVPVDVPDPYHGGAQDFDRVLDMMEAACPRILDHLLERTG